MTFLRALSLLVLSILLLCGSGCRLGYYLHLSAGQLGLLCGAVPVEEALRENSLTPDEQERLKLISRIKQFGETEMGLKKTENFQTVYLKSRQNPIYTISASPKDRLTRMTWWFPIVGDMPYLGFFDLEGARKERDKLLQQDLDVAIGRADAYSTLGWFKDPVTRNLLKESVPELIETILHEMTHTTLYVKGQGEFNEGMAMLVGLIGAVRFLEKNYPPAHSFVVEAKDSLQDQRLFSVFLDSLVTRLEKLYGSSATYHEKVSDRERIFSGALEEFGRLKPAWKTDRFSGFGKAGINNAYLMSLVLYHRHHALFDAFLKAHDGSLREMIQALGRLAGEGGDLLGKMRAALAGQQ